MLACTSWYLSRYISFMLTPAPTPPPAALIEDAVSCFSVRYLTDAIHEVVNAPAPVPVEVQCMVAHMAVSLPYCLCLRIALHLFSHGLKQIFSLPWSLVVCIATVLLDEPNKTRTADAGRHGMHHRYMRVVIFDGSICPPSYLHLGWVCVCVCLCSLFCCVL